MLSSLLDRRKVGRKRGFELKCGSEDGKAENDISHQLSSFLVNRDDKITTNALRCGVLQVNKGSYAARTALAVYLVISKNAR